MIARLVTFIFGLAFASSCLAADEQSDAQLTKLMVGAWRSPRGPRVVSSLTWPWSAMRCVRP